MRALWRPMGSAQHGFTLIELMIVVSIIGILASIAIPAFVKYVKQSKTTEIAPNLKAIAEGAATYYTVDHYTAQGLPLSERQFPTPNSSFGSTGAARVPLVITPGTKHPTLYTDWNIEPWIGLKYQMIKPHYYRYRYHSVNQAGSGIDSFSARAEGDLDSDTATSRFNITGYADASHNILVSGIFMTDGTTELE